MNKFAMKFFKFTNFNLGVFAIFFGIPITQILQNDQEFFISNNSYLFIFYLCISICFLLTSSIFLFDKKIIYKFFSICFFQYINLLCLKFFEYFIDENLIFVLIFSTIFFFIISLIDFKKIYSFVSLLSILFVLQSFLIFFNISNIDRNEKNYEVTKNNIIAPNIYFVIFDEISLDFITKENVIDNKYENIKIFSENSTNFLNAHTSYDFTSKASLALLTGGESIVNDLLNSKDHYFKDINKYSDNLYSLLAKNYSLNVISSYDYCYYHSKYLDTCISSINKSKNIITNIINFSNTYYNYSLPRFLINLLDARGIIIKDNNIYNYINNEIWLSEHFINNVENNESSNNFYLFHSMVSHQPWIFDQKGNLGSIVEFDRDIENKNIKKLSKSYENSLKYTDNIFGQFIDNLKKNDLYDSSIIIFASDHGVSLKEDNFLRMNGLANSSITKIPLMIKLPNQNKQEFINHRFSLSNLLQLFKRLQNRTFDQSTSSLSIYSNLEEFRQFPFITLTEEYDLNGKIRYKKNTYCNDQNGEYYRLNNENFNSDTYNFCITD